MLPEHRPREAQGSPLVRDTAESHFIQRTCLVSVCPSPTQPGLMILTARQCDPVQIGRSGASVDRRDYVSGSSGRALSARLL